LRAELLAAEAAHKAKLHGGPAPESDTTSEPATSASKRPLEIAPQAEGEEDTEAKRRRILEETRDIDADDSDEEEEDDDSDDSSDDEDETAELQRELEKIRRERAEKREREVGRSRMIPESACPLTLCSGTRTSCSRTRCQRARYRPRKPPAEQAGFQHQTAMG